MLTEEQEQAAKQMLDLKKTGEVLFLSAGPGTGKTYTICNTFNDGRTVLFLCPTHASKDIIRKELGENPNGHIVETAHTMVGWYVKTQMDGREVERCRPCSPTYKKEIWSRADILVVEEASMVSELLINVIFEYSELYNLPILFCGDMNQLPCPNSKYSVFDQAHDYQQFWTFDYDEHLSEEENSARFVDLEEERFAMHTKYPLVMLHEPIRFKSDSGIAEFVDEIREKIENCDYKKMSLQKYRNYSDLDFLKEAEWYETLENMRNWDEDDLICVAFDHDSLREIKAKITGSGYLFEVRDTVRCLKTTKEFKNGEEFKIFNIFTGDGGFPYSTYRLDVDFQNIYAARPKWLRHEDWKNGEFTFQFQHLHARKIENGVETEKYQMFAVPIDDITANAVKNINKKLKKEGLASLELPEISPIQNNWLRTVHCAQGSSFDNVFIHSPSVLKKKGMYKMKSKTLEHLRLVYVAISRAKNKLYILD